MTREREARLREVPATPGSAQAHQPDIPRQPEIGEREHERDSSQEGLKAASRISAALLALVQDVSSDPGMALCEKQCNSDDPQRISSFEGTGGIDGRRKALCRDEFSLFRGQDHELSGNQMQPAARVVSMVAHDHGKLRRTERAPAAGSTATWRVFAPHGLQSILLKFFRAMFYVGMALAVLTYGAVLDEHFLPAAIVIGSALFGACLLVHLREQTRELFWATLVVLVTGAAYIFAQSLLFVGNPFAHEIWSDPLVRDIVGGAGAVSVDPAATRRALLSFALPFATFLAALALFDSDEAALRLWRRLAFAGAAIACLGLAEYFFTPERLLFSERRHLQNAVTGVFVNRNTASTFFGVTLLLLVGVAVDLWRRIDPLAFGRWLLRPAILGAGRHLRFCFALLCMLVTSLALVLTLSRAGVVASFAALAPVLVWVGLRYGLREAPLWKRVAVSVGFTVLSLIVLLQMAARVALRIESKGIEDSRWCIAKDAMNAIADNPIWGTGLGTFESVYPGYRDADCRFSGVIDIAHSVYLEAYLGLGVAAPILLIRGLWVLGRALRQGMRRRRYRFASVIGFAIIFLVLLHSLFDFSLQIPGFSVYFAAALASAVSLAQGRAAERRRP